VAVLLAVGLVSKAIADGIPLISPLTYSGVLQNSNGTPVTTLQSIRLQLFNDAAATAAGNQACDTPAQNITPDATGRFQIVLAQACVAAVKQNADLWVELSVNGTRLMPRSKLGAVPFAVEAARAGRAIARPTTFGADGGIATTLDGLYCGSGASTTGAFSDGAAIGLRAGKSLCEAACASATAHLCTFKEVSQSYELGMEVPDGWAKSLNGETYNNAGSSNLVLNDCTDWTVGSTQTGGFYTNQGGAWASGHMSLVGCGSSQPPLCCD
jgi:hypothetical protein